MKLIAIILLPVFSLAQPPKKSSKVIVTIADTASVFNRLSLAIFDRGYTFETKDDQLKLVSTNEKPVKKGGASAKIRARIIDSTIVLTGVIALDVEMTILGVKMERTFSKVEYIGAKKSPMREAWNELVEIAQMFGTSIRFE